jgi:DNA-binding response OmpR family regulator
MSGEQILIVEDDKHISKLVKYNLEKAGFLCHIVITGEEALDILNQRKFQLIVLDIMLPRMDGFELCKFIRQDSRHKNVSIMMLTARGEEVDRIVGFELGVDDYMVKPFSPRELVLRVKAIFRRGASQDFSEKDVLTMGRLAIDIPRHEVKIDKKLIDLSPMEFKLLVVLLERKGRVQSRERLLNDVWGISADVTTRTVDTHVKLLRQKLGKSENLIETVRGIGYKINDEV